MRERGLIWGMGDKVLVGPTRALTLGRCGGCVDLNSPHLIPRILSTFPSAVVRLFVSFPIYFVLMGAGGWGVVYFSLRVSGVHKGISYGFPSLCRFIAICVYFDLCFAIFYFIIHQKVIGGRLFRP